MAAFGMMAREISRGTAERAVIIEALLGAVREFEWPRSYRDDDPGRRSGPPGSEGPSKSRIVGSIASARIE
jgi:hypothetical protein